ncbi:MAG TPA: MFS transporter [Alphaproteobacteria bacterium]|nr:MFS transporter [Alphaproteobacteria bacterium]
MITPTAPEKSASSTVKSTSWFSTADGKNYAFIFLLVSSLFLLWGVCNGMIDVLNKHFQDSLQLTKAESACVQLANYMGYFVMAIPAGLLAIRFGYKGAIIIGLALVALGALWFIPATHIGTYWAFLFGIFLLAAGLPCLETVCNPYATVLGPPESGTPRINLAQSANGIGWMIGPVLGGYFVLSATGEPITNNATLFEPYLIIGAVVIGLIIIFVLTKVPDLHNVEETEGGVETGNGRIARKGKPLFKRWHFTLAVAAQFFYVAAQTGVFSFFINYVATDTPVLKQGQARALQGYANGLHNVFRIPLTPMTYSAALFSAGDIGNVPALIEKLQNDPDSKTRPVSEFIWNSFSTNRSFLVSSSFGALAVEMNAPSSISEAAAELDNQARQKKEAILVNGLNQILETNLLFSAMASSGIVLPDAQRQLVESEASGEALVRANRAFLEKMYSADLVPRSPYLDGPFFRITDRGASVLLSFGGFALFLLGRITGSLALRVYRPYLMLALYSALNIAMMVLVMNTWGWLSVAGLFLSFFFMSITYPTIFSLGIHGLGENTKIASSFIVMSIAGGAFMPLLMGWMADQWGMRIGFGMPLGCFIFVALYAALWRRLEARDSGG